jgi:tRNA-binding protein
LVKEIANPASRYSNPEASTPNRPITISTGGCCGLQFQVMEPASIKEQITAAELDKVDIRVGTIQAVEDIRDSQKLVRLVVDFGDHKRTIVAGLKQERAEPSEIIGKQALFVLNLEARKIHGILSEGMLFDIGYADGIRPVLAMPESWVPNGARAG